MASSSLDSSTLLIGAILVALLIKMSFLFSYVTLVFLVSFGLMLVTLLAIYRMKKTARFRDLMSRLPQGPKPLPVFGNSFDLFGGLDCKYI